MRYDPLVPLGPDPVPIHVEAFLRILGAKKPSANTVAAYRRDLVGVAMRIAALKGVPVAELRVDALTRSSSRQTSASDELGDPDNSSSAGYIPASS